jgi:histidinol-phosphate aminotransferase
MGGGSVAVLAHILQAYCAPGDEVVYAWRSFEAYPILTRLVGAEPVQVPLTADARHDLPAMAAAVTERTKVVMVCSPNNPTGPAVREDEFREFMAAVPERVLVVLDEAYLEFVSDPHAVLGRPLLGMYANLVLLRTFSKAYGLAGLRVGYVAGPEPLVTPVRSCVTPFSVSGPAQAAGLASLAATAELDHRVQVIVAERDRVAAALRMDGWTVPEAQGNFVWLSPGELTVDLATHLGAASTPILVRPFAGNGLRVTIGSPEENDAALAALAAFPARA